MNNRYSRNEALFGSEGQHRIAQANVVIVGLGGLGAHVAQQLAYLGVRRFGLIDFDRVTESSLNRLVGATHDDVLDIALKVDVAERMIRLVQPDAMVEKVAEPLINARAESLIGTATVVFSCVDRDIHRLDLLDRCAAFGVPMFDAATDVDTEHGDLNYGGRVVVCDGRQCIVCLPEILDQHQIARDRMTPDLRDANDRIYGVSADALDRSGPSVVSINGVVASLAVTEFMASVSGLRSAIGQLTYRADRGGVTRSKDEGELDCYYCVPVRDRLKDLATSAQEA